jgi:hypothetical protein
VTKKLIAKRRWKSFVSYIEMVASNRGWNTPIREGRPNVIPEKTLPRL